MLPVTGFGCTHCANPAESARVRHIITWPAVSAAQSTAGGVSIIATIAYLPCTLKTFDTLSTVELYAILRLRVDVFVVEQQCLYPELDGLDLLPDTLHMQHYEADRLVGYARLLNTQHETEPLRIGRVVTDAAYRTRGVARRMMQQLLATAAVQYPSRAIVLSAQAPLAQFYASLSFRATSDVYVEDGIAHVDMVLLAKS